MSGDNVRIKIGSEADTAGFDKTTKAMDGLKAAGIAVTGVLAGIGLSLAGGAIDRLADIPRIFTEAITEGVKFNATLESARLGVAAIYKQFAGDRFPTFETAMAGADKAVSALQAKAAVTNATFSQLLGGYQATVGALFAAGITDMQKQVDTIGLLANSVAAVIPDPSQLVQEMRAILTGNITPDAQAANTFGITAESIRSAKEAGTLFEYLEGKLSAFAEAGERGGQTMNTAMGNLKEALVALETEAAKPVFEALKDIILDLNGALTSETAKNTAGGISSLIQSSRDAAAGALPTLKELAGIYAMMHPITAGVLKGAIATGQSGFGQLQEAGHLERLLNRNSAHRGWEAPSEGKDEFKTLPDTKEQAAGRLKVAAAEDAFTTALQRQLPVVEQLATARANVAMAINHGGGDIETTGLSAKDIAEKVRVSSMDAASKVQILASLQSILSLEKQVTDEKENQAKEEREDLDAAIKLIAEEEKREKMSARKVSDLQDEYHIQEQLAAGHTALATEMQRTLKLKQEIAAIDESDLTPEAKEKSKQLARDTSELEKQKALKDLDAKRTDLKAADAVAAAKDGHSKSKLRDAELNQQWLQRKKELEGAGLPTDDAAKASFLGTARKRYNREHGIIGGSAEPKVKPQKFSGLDALNELQNKPNAPKFAGLDALRELQNKPIADLTPLRPDNAPAIAPAGLPAAEPPKAGNALENAGKAAQTANQQLEIAAKELQVLSTDAANALDTINSVLPVLSITLQTSNTALTNLEARVNTLETTSGT